MNRRIQGIISLGSCGAILQSCCRGNVTLQRLIDFLLEYTYYIVSISLPGAGYVFCRGHRRVNNLANLLRTSTAVSERKSNPSPSWPPSPSTLLFFSSPLMQDDVIMISYPAYPTEADLAGQAIKATPLLLLSPFNVVHGKCAYSFVAPRHEIRVADRPAHLTLISISKLD